MTTKEAKVLLTMILCQFSHNFKTCRDFHINRYVDFHVFHFSVIKACHAGAPNHIFMMSLDVCEIMLRNGA